MKDKYLEHIIEIVVSILVNLLVMYLVNKYYTNVSFLNSDFTQILPIWNLSIQIQVVLYATRLLITDHRYKKITEVINNFIYIYLAYMIWNIFPFSFSIDIWNILVRTMLIVSSFGVCIAIIVNTVKVVLNKE